MGYFMVVIGEENGLLLVCDGKERPIERPKKKNQKHLSFTNAFLEKDSYKTNKSLRKALATYRATLIEEDQ